MNAMTAIHLATLVRQDPIADELWTECGNMQGVGKLSLDTYINQSLALPSTFTPDTELVEYIRYNIFLDVLSKRILDKLLGERINTADGIFVVNTGSIDFGWPKIHLFNTTYSDVAVCMDLTIEINGYGLDSSIWKVWQKNSVVDFTTAPLYLKVENHVSKQGHRIVKALTVKDFTKAVFTDFVKDSIDAILG